MWSYFGTKLKIAKHYPAPQYDTIIEPFCGAARYSLYDKNWEKRIILVDKYSVITNLWLYLIRASSQDILALPDMEYGDKVTDHKQLCEEERHLIGFCINSASSSPKITTQKYNSWNRTKKYIAENLYKIRHWEVHCGEYKDIDNRQAVWFVDSPYVGNGGKYYRHSNKDIDYNHLGQWCQSRLGQTIVCENSEADWLPFEPLVELRGQLHKTYEVMWHRSEYDV